MTFLHLFDTLLRTYWCRTYWRAIDRTPLKIYVIFYSFNMALGVFYRMQSNTNSSFMKENLRIIVIKEPKYPTS